MSAANTTQPQRDFSQEEERARRAYYRCNNFRQLIADGEIDDPLSFYKEEQELADALAALDKAAGTLVTAIVKTDRGEASVVQADINGVTLDPIGGGRLFRRHRSECTPTGRSLAKAQGAAEIDSTPACGGDPRCKTHQGGKFDVFGERECRR